VALVLGLKVARKMKIMKLAVLGDSELVVQQVKNIYQTKHPRMRAYRNLIWDLIDNFFQAFNITAVPRDLNQQADSLALAASTFKSPIIPQIKSEVEMRHRASILDNVKHWQVFEDDQ